MKYQILIVICIALIFSACENITEPNALVPATVDQNPDLPQMEIKVKGHTRKIHYRTLGNSTNPVFLIMHGSLSDMRVYTPFAQQFADKYYVVLWDQRGNGLSERVSAEELSYDAMVEEINQMKQHFSPEAPITILGHSWSALFAVDYIGDYPLSVKQAVLMEPPGLKDEFMDHISVPLNLFTKGYLDMYYSTQYLTPKSHEMLDFEMLGTLKSAVRNFFCDQNNLPPWPVWRVGGFALIVWERNILSGTKYDYDFTAGLENYPNSILFVGSSCSPIGYDFQKNYNATVFKNASVLKIPNSGHRMITEQFDLLVAGIKEYLEEY